MATVAQPVRVPGCGPGGRRFKSDQSPLERNLRTGGGNMPLPVLSRGYTKHCVTALAIDEGALFVAYNGRAAFG